MDAGQEQFLQFILERVQDGRQDDMKALLSESFGKISSGGMTPEYLEEFTPKMLAMLKPEAVEEVKQITAQFGSQF